MLSDIDASIRLVKGRCENLTQKVEELEQVTQVADPAYIAQYYTQNGDMIQKTCLMDSELPQLRAIPTSSVDLAALDHFLENVKLNFESASNSFEQQSQGSRQPPIPKKHEMTTPGGYQIPYGQKGLHLQTSVAQEMSKLKQGKSSHRSSRTHL